MRPQRVCLDCPTLTRNPRGRCRPCQQVYDKARNAQPNKQAYTRSGYRELRKRVRVGEYGPCVDCAGWVDLTVDHVVPVILGGEHGPLAVRCRTCNSRKGATLPGMEKRFPARMRRRQGGQALNPMAAPPPARDRAPNPPPPAKRGGA